MDKQRKDKSTLLGTILVSHGVLSMGQVHEATCKQHNTGKLFGEMLQELGMATLSQIKAGLADQQYRRKDRIEPSSVMP